MKPQPSPSFGPLIKVWRPAHLDRVELGHGKNIAHSFPRHWHDEFHLSLITDGAGWLQCRGRKHLAPSGSLSLVPPGEVHANPCEPAGCSFRNIYIHPRLVEDAAAQITGKAAFFPDFRERLFTDKRISGRFLRLHRELETAGSRLRDESLLSAFLTDLILHCADPKPSPAKMGRESLAVRRMREYITEHHEEGIPLANLARLANLSPFHLNHAFCREVGMPPHAYQIQVRLARAKLLLIKQVPISEVALATGFADQSHFTRHFRKATSVTPAQYAARPQERSRPALNL